MKMCLECYNNLTENNLDRNDVFLTTGPHFCEECGKPKRVIINIAGRQTPFFFCAAPCQEQRVSPTMAIQALR